MTTQKMDGRCLCGNTSYTAHTKPLRMVTCQCKTCQRASGSAFSTNVILASDTFEILTGTPACVEITADSGNVNKRFFCSDCGSHLYSNSPARPGLMVLRAGTLDDTSWVAPQARIWCEMEQSWLKDVDFGLPSLAQGPPSK